MRGAYTWPPIISRRYRPRAGVHKHTSEKSQPQKQKKMNKEAKRDGDYVSYSELFRLVQAGRRELGLPEYTHRSSRHLTASPPKK